jgi:hypothetical protein
MPSYAMVGFFVVCSASPALADVPPEDDYVELCLAEIQARPGEECVECPTSQGLDNCQTSWGTQGYHRRCSQWGATHRTELWCNGNPPVVDQLTVNSAPADTETVMAASIAGVGCCVLGLVALGAGGVFVLSRRKK